MAPHLGDEPVAKRLLIKSALELTEEPLDLPIEIRGGLIIGH